MVVLLVYSPHLGVSGKVTHFHRFSSLLDLKKSHDCFIVVYVVLKLL
jgi:hypothetical protein